MTDKSLMSKQLRDDLKHTIFSEIGLRFSEPKTRRKAFSILESAIQLFDRKGFENVTFVMIARECALTTPSLRHYFENLEDIRETALKYIHLLSQRIIIDSLSDSDEPRKMLRQYIAAHAKWGVNFKTHIRLWLAVLSYSSRVKADREFNTKLMNNGARRIVQMLKRGREQGVFKHANDEHTATLIQTIMLGWLIKVVTEELSESSELQQSIVIACEKCVL